MSVYQKLIEGRERIRRGWTQHVWHTSDLTAFCALGALMPTDSSRMSRGIPMDAALALKAELPETFNGTHEWTVVAVFNDSPNRTKEEVLALYDRAIAKAARPGAEIAKEIMAKPRIPEDVKSEEITTC